jgi:hypothetical protein
VDGREHWRENCRAVSPPGAVVVDVGRSRASLASARERVAGLEAGTPVVLLSPAPGASRRCRSFAARAGIRLDRDYLAFPSAATPAYLVANEVAPVRAFLRSVLVAPPGTRVPFVFELGIAILRALGPRAAGAVAPGRVVVGWRS